MNYLEKMKTFVKNSNEIEARLGFEDKSRLIDFSEDFQIGLCETVRHLKCGELSLYTIYVYSPDAKDFCNVRAFNYKKQAENAFKILTT